MLLWVYGMPDIAHFYHVYAVGGWRDVVAEHLDAVVGSGLPIAAINLGVVGTPEAQEQACALVRSRIPVSVVARAEQGAEEITLAALWRESPPIGLYAHTKGVHVATAFNAVPAVFVTPLNATTNVTGTMIGYCATNIVGVIPGLTTTSNFVYAAGNTNTYSLQYIAIGQP